MTADDHATLSIAERAAEIAAQRVAAIHRRRLVAQTFLAALVVSAGIALVVAMVVADSSASQNSDRIAQIIASRQQSRKLVYCGIDQLAHAVDTFLKPPSSAELRREGRQIDAAIQSDGDLSSSAKHLLRTVLDSLVIAEATNPKLTHLRNFHFKVLPCARTSH